MENDMRICKYETCANKHDSHGYCANHARQYRRWGRIRSKEEVAKEISDRNKGHQYLKGKTWKISEEKRLAMKGVRKNTGRTHFAKGFIPWNKDKKGLVVAWNKGKESNKPAWNKGLYGWNAGEKNPNWQGGLRGINYAVRRTKRYAAWRMSVFERDNFTCQHCYARGVYLEADHIKPFAFFPELRFELYNGRTLCKECHMKTPTYKRHKLVEVTP